MSKLSLSYFCRIKELNCNFVYDIDLDNEFYVRNVFWVDTGSRATNKAFGDAMTFDTTYLKNNYEMPFAAFVGVNHCRQTSLLEYGLLS